MIWLLRPGGLADRQPRSSWLVGFVIGAVAVSSYVVLRPSSRLKISRRIALGGSYALIAVAAVVAGFVWPHGLIRHTPSFATLPTTPVTAPPTSTGASTTTTKAGATTTARGATTAPAATTAPRATTTVPAKSTTSGP
jgi:hypothetical protein